MVEITKLNAIHLLGHLKDYDCDCLEEFIAKLKPIAEKENQDDMFREEK